MNKALLFLCCTFLASSAYPAYAEVIKDIQIDGNRRIDDSTIEAYSGVEPNQDLDNEDLDQIVRNLYKSNFFLNINAEIDKGSLKIRVWEKPIINKVIIKGNNAISSDILKKSIQMKSGGVYSDDVAEKTVQIINSYYQGSGRYSSTVEVQIEKLDRNRVNVYMIVTEGPVLKIRGIDFIGNEKFSDYKLKNALNMSVTSPFNIFSVQNRFEQFRMENQRKLIENFYRKNGYIEVKVTSSIAHISADYNSAYIFFTIEEGKQYKFGKISIKSDIYGLYTADLFKGIKIKEGQIFSPNKARRYSSIINNNAIDYGYPFAVASLDTKVNEKAKTIDVIYKLTNSQKIYVDTIEIRGNNRTLSNVIRSKLTFQEGDPINYKFMRESEFKIMSLGHISRATISFQKVPGLFNKVKVIVDVQEAASGYISFSGGYSTTEKIVVQALYKEGNFLGTNLDFSLQANVSLYNVDFTSNIGIPDFPSPDSKLNFSLFTRHVNSPMGNDFTKREVGGSIGVSYLISPTLSQSLSYTGAFTRLTRRQSLFSTKSLLDIFSGEGKYTFESYIKSNLKWRPRFNIEGGTFSISSKNELGGFELKKKIYITEELEVYYKHKLPFAGSYLILSGSAGWWQKQDSAGLTPDQGFSVGGQNFLGFVNSGLNPRLKKNTLGISRLGADTYVKGHAQFALPLMDQRSLNIYGIGFISAGTAYLRNSTIDQKAMYNSRMIRVSTGIGFKWNSPFGPMQFTWSFPIRKYHSDTTQLFQFTMGKIF